MSAGTALEAFTELVGGGVCRHLEPLDVVAAATSLHRGHERGVTAGPIDSGHGLELHVDGVVRAGAEEMLPVIDPLEPLPRGEPDAKVFRLRADAPRSADVQDDLVVAITVGPQRLGAARAAVELLKGDARKPAYELNVDEHVLDTLGCVWGREGVRNVNELRIATLTGHPSEVNFSARLRLAGGTRASQMAAGRRPLHGFTAS